jgi:hypothetical protein
MNRRHASLRQLTIAAVQVAAMTLLWLFLSHVYVPTFGILGTLLWLACCFWAACALDVSAGRGWPLRFRIAACAVMTANFAIFFLSLKLFDAWGLIEAPLFAFVGYRLADTLDARVQA